MTILTTTWTTEDYHRMIEAGVLEGHQVELLNGDILDMLPDEVRQKSEKPNRSRFPITLNLNQISRLDVGNFRDDFFVRGALRAPLTKKSSSD